MIINKVKLSTKKTKINEKLANIGGNKGMTETK